MLCDVMVVVVVVVVLVAVMLFVAVVVVGFLFWVVCADVRMCCDAASLRCGVGCS